MRLILRFPSRASGFSGVSRQGLLLSAVMHLGAAVLLLALANQRPAEPNRFPVTTVMLVAGGRLAPPTATPAPAPRQPLPPTAKSVPSPQIPAPAKPQPPRPRPTDPSAVPATPDPAPLPASQPVPTAAGAEPSGSMEAGFAPAVAGGDPGGVPSIDSAAFPFAYYRSLITNRLRATWSRPVVPGGLTAPLRATLRFEILRGGALAEITLVSESGYKPLDRSALRAAYAANPLPPLPEDFDGERLAVNFYFELLPEP